MKKKITFKSLVLQQNVLTILLLSFVAVAVWIGFSIYFSYSKTTISSIDASLIAPLTPKINTAIFDALAARKTWSDAELASFTPSIDVTTTTQSQNTKSTQVVAKLTNPIAASVSASTTTSVTTTASPSGAIKKP